MPKNLNTCKTLGQHYVTSFSEDVLNGYVTNPNPTLTLTKLTQKSKKKQL
jgi:hypothetical protein